MTTKSPTTSVRSREVIGVDQFSQRREVFDKHDTVFLPLPSPTNSMAYKEVEPIVTSNHGKTTANFKRNAPTYSSMRESRNEDRNVEFRTRKYSDNFTSELNQSDNVDRRSSMTERTRRLSKLRRDFLNSNLHEPNESPFARTGVRASMPVHSTTAIKYKIESPNLYKFPFAEPYATPPPVRRVVVDLGPAEINGEKENHDPKTKPKHQSLPNHDVSPKIEHQKLFEELVKRYSPQRKPVDFNLPPTRPRVVGSVPKSTSSAADSVDSSEKKMLDEVFNKLEDDDVFVKKDTNVQIVEETKKKNEEDFNQKSENQLNNNVEIKQNGPGTLVQEEGNAKRKEDSIENDTKPSLAELEEKNDEVPELSTLQRQGRENKKPSLEKYTDLSIPALIEKINEEGDDLESHKKDNKKVKRKRSFLDKLLGRKKDK